MIAAFPVAESVAFAALKAERLYLLWSLLAAAFLAACLYAVPLILRFFDDRISGSRKGETFSKGVKR